MQLATHTPPPDWGRLAAFSRLDPRSDAPLAVAISGGGDSLAALIHACAWAKMAGRPVLALCVDHGLQVASPAWSRAASAAAASLGAGFQPLAWTGDKPATGLPAAARAARHALLADAARKAGCTAIVTGHTRDDQAENAVMGLGPLRDWSPSPAWPQGRGIFLLRPLLESSRAQIRADLAVDGWDWIDDPANDDPKYLRARVRAEGVAALPNPESQTPGPAPSDEGLRFPRATLTARAVAVAAVCAGGGSRLPRAKEVARILSRLQAGEHFTATLCGARITAADQVSFTREPGRQSLPTLPLTPGEPLVWDGRYELETDLSGLSVGPLAGSAAKLSKAEQATLRRMEAWARPGLPLIRGMDEIRFCPLLAGDNVVRARSLVTERYLAACDLIATEQAAVTSRAWRTAFARPMLGALG